MKFLLTFCLATCGLMVQCTKHSAMQATELQCEYLATPLGIDVAEPRLMWKLESPVGNTTQRAYRVSVATSAERLREGQADVWTSGRIESDDQTVVCRPDAPLQSHTRYFWQVETWDGDDVPADAPVSWFETGKMTPDAWQAQWITDSHDMEYGPAPMFRHEFEAGKRIASARAYICGLGYYELYLNGERVGDHLLDPGYTDFSKRVLYVTYDITDQLDKGKNCIGVVLGNGWYNEQAPAVWNFHQAPWRNRPRLLCELRIVYRDGSTETIGSDASWKTATGPLLYDNLYIGATYDARLEQPGWNRVGYADSQWESATPTQSPAPIVEAQKMAAVAATATIRPESVTKINDTLYLYDLGKNFAGVCRLHVRGPRGTVVTMRHGEMLDSAGRVDQRNINMHLRPAHEWENIIQFDKYTLKGDGRETFMPPFVYHGFQYVEVATSAPMTLTADNLEGVVMHSDVRPTGDFSCSNELINKIFDISKRSYLSNLFGIPTDCPHREKNGWMADGYMVQEAGMINYDSRNVYAKWVNDMIDAQDTTGNVPGIVPTSWQWDSDWAGPLWDAAIFITPDLLYQYTGDVRVLDAIYPTAKRYLEYLQTREEENGTINHGLGDWLFYKAQTPVDFLATCYYYWDNMLMAQMARLTGRPQEAAPYEMKAGQLKTLINNLFFDPQKVCYSNGTQLSYALPLYLGIVPEQYEAQLAANMNRCIAENDYSLDYGFIGSLVVPAALSDHGYADAAYRMITKTTMPSWGYWIERFGATSLFENWDVMKNVGDASRNHPSMGAASAWMYRTLAGIRVDPAQPAFRHVLIRPCFVDGLEWVKASYDSQRGEIRSAWERNGDEATLTVQIPANVTATVILPSEAVKAIDGDGKNIPESESDDSASYRIGSGTSRFSCRVTK